MCASSCWVCVPCSRSMPTSPIASHRTADHPAPLRLLKLAWPLGITRGTGPHPPDGWNTGWWCRHSAWRCLISDKAGCHWQYTMCQISFQGRMSSWYKIVNSSLFKWKLVSSKYRVMLRHYFSARRSV